MNGRMPSIFRVRYEKKWREELENEDDKNKNGCVPSIFKVRWEKRNWREE